MSEKVDIRSIVNKRGETIEVGFIVTVVEQEWRYGTGEVMAIRGRLGGPHFALVLWEDPRPGEARTGWFGCDELTNINLAARDRTMYG